MVQFKSETLMSVVHCLRLNLGDLGTWVHNLSYLPLLDNEQNAGYHQLVSACTIVQLLGDRRRFLRS